MTHLPKCKLIFCLLLINYFVWMFLWPKPPICNCRDSPSIIKPDPILPSNSHCFSDAELLSSFTLEPPPRADVPSLLAHLVNKSISQSGQDMLVDEILGEQRNGFFVECGAYDGAVHSNSLFFENNRGWTGLLVEPNPRAYHELVVRDRHAWTARACLSTSGRFEMVDFMNDGEIGGVMNDNRRARHPGGTNFFNPYIYKSRVPCYPIAKMLAALNRTVIDYFSLDVEGAELGVLESFPWDTVLVRVWTIEHVNPTRANNPAMYDMIMQKHGYKMSAQQVELDRVYYHESVRVPARLVRH